MEIYTSEQEQLDEIKKWWAENSKAVILGLIIGGAGLFAWQSWDKNQKKMAEDASQLYSAMMLELEAGQLARINEYADEMVKDFSDTAYASLTAMAAAKANVKLGKPEDAKTHLQWVIEHSELNELVYVAKLRLVSLHLASNEYEQAAAILGRFFPEPYKAMVDELKGDLFVAQGDIEEAKFAYDQALATELPTQKRQLVQLKRDELGEKPAAQPKQDKSSVIQIKPIPVDPNADPNAPKPPE